MASFAQTAWQAAASVLSAPSFWGALIPVSVLAFMLWRKARRGSATLSVAGLASITFDLTDADRALAWKLHVQLVTRKAALPFDEAGDVIADVFASLFDLFSATREMLLEMPPSDSRDGDSVAHVAIRVLNDTVRPRLTRWHADYRRWWDQETALPANANRSPQEIQRDYARYSELVADVREMNTELSMFADELAALAAGRRGVAKRLRRARPTAPIAVVSAASPPASLLPPTDQPR